MVTGDFAIVEHQATQAAFKNYAPFTKCITKIDGITIDNAEDLDLVRKSNFIKAMRQLILITILETLMIFNFYSTRINY